MPGGWRLIRRRTFRDVVGYFPHKISIRHRMPVVGLERAAADNNGVGSRVTGGTEEIFQSVNRQVQEELVHVRVVDMDLPGLQWSYSRPISFQIVSQIEVVNTPVFCDLMVNGTGLFIPHWLGITFGIGRSPDRLPIGKIPTAA